MNSTIRFLRLNPYRRAIGSLDSGMGFGVHDALVRRGVAEFVTTPAASPAIEAAATPNTETASEHNPRRAYTRRAIKET